jgi:peroxiredoxin
MKLMTALLVLLISYTVSALETGMTSPDFSLAGTASKGKEVKLSDHKGKIVVLEWLNHGCPFVRKHYDSNNMQALQKKYIEKNVIWLSIISSAPGKQGHVDVNEASEDVKRYKSSATSVLLDPSGKVGQLYGVKTTPHMYIIDKEGTLVYQGAIDDKPDTAKDSIPGAKNFVNQALEEVIAGKKVSIPKTKSYGCSVKY